LLTSQGRQTGVQYVKLRAPDRAELNIYNTQLGLLINDPNQPIQVQEQDQQQQIQEIFNFINQNDPNSRILLGGTFNTIPGSDIYQFVSQTFVDPFGGLQTEKATTLKLVNGDVARVDYLWMRNITGRFVSIVPITVSSHNMAVVEIGLLQSTG
jgi:endonuclease/exonuclease/phosphatase (EEP) superfamily protein YafD